MTRDVLDYSALNAVRMLNNNQPVLYNILVATVFFIAILVTSVFPCIITPW